MTEFNLMPKEMAELVDKIKALGPFFHQFVLPGGTWTRPMTGNPWDDHYPHDLWLKIQPHVPDVTGKRCLDIGCNAGALTFLLANKGAEHVLGVDVSQPGNPFFEKTIQKARLMQELFKQDAVEFREQDFLEMPEREEFDFILCLGVYYHLEHHDFCMPKLKDLLKPGGIVLIESAVGDQPKHYREGEVYHDDVTNHFVPSVDYLMQDAKQWGFEVEACFGFLNDRFFMRLRKA